MQSDDNTVDIRRENRYSARSIRFVRMCVTKALSDLKQGLVQRQSFARDVARQRLAGAATVLSSISAP
jgi:hypothetical protein